MIGKRNDVDDIGDPVTPCADARLAPLSEFPADLPLDLPALRRDEVRIAGILAILGQFGLGEEVIEADLPDAAAKLEACIPPARRPPARG